MSVHDYCFESSDKSVNNSCLTADTLDKSLNSLPSNYNYGMRPAMATLCNIGNTCYLNSVVYTLRFAPQFLHNLHHLVEDLSNVHKRIVKTRSKSSSLDRSANTFPLENLRSVSSKDLATLENMTTDIPKTNQLLATEKLHELYQNLNRNEKADNLEPFHADLFLRAIQDVNTIFEGNQQQDAHEFLMCVLDSIRETCSALTEAIRECPDIITNGHLNIEERNDTQLPIKNEQNNELDITSLGIGKPSFFSRISSKKKCNGKAVKNVHITTGQKYNVISVINDPISNDGVSENKNVHNLNDKNDFVMDDKTKLNEKIRKLGLDFFSEDFEGITVSTTKCLSCETVTEQKEAMIDIAVPITNCEDIDLTDKYHLFIQNSCMTRENFRGENKYRCEKCIGYTEAIRSISYEVLPRLLVIQLSRFSGGMEKISSYFPTPFVLQCFCAKCCSLPENKKLHVYKLYSVITHVGASMSVGHYIAYTCSLDASKDYINCSKVRKCAEMNFSNTSANSINCNNSAITEQIINTDTKNRLLKKKIFGRNKSNNSGDISKHVKKISHFSNLTKSLDKLTLLKSISCQSINCCGIQLKHNVSSSNEMNFNNISSSVTNNSAFPDMSNDDIISRPYLFNKNDLKNTSNFNNSPKSHCKEDHNFIEPVWYMCDDDKIKTMTQSEFEELLSPKRKIMITPYLLFYARSNIQ